MTTIGSTLDFASSFLKKGGNFVCKILESEAEPLLDVSVNLYHRKAFQSTSTKSINTSPQLLESLHLSAFM